MVFFFFGTLRDRDVLEVVVGRPVDDDELKRAFLPDYTLATTTEDNLPVLMPCADGRVDGVVFVTKTSSANYEVDATCKDLEADRVAFFEDVEYQPSTLSVILENGKRQQARVYFTTHLNKDSASCWDFDRWQQEHKSQLLCLARQWMTHIGEADLTAAETEWDDLRAKLYDLNT